MSELQVAVTVASRTKRLTVWVFLSVMWSFPFQFAEALSFVSLFACSRPFDCHVPVAGTSEVEEEPAPFLEWVK